MSHEAEEMDLSMIFLTTPEDPAYKSESSEKMNQQKTHLHVAYKPQSQTPDWLHPSGLQLVLSDQVNYFLNQAKHLSVHGQ